MPGDPFDLDEGFENIPIVKGPSQAVNKVANSGTKYTKQQAAAMTKSFVSQLYGSSTQTTDDDQQQNANVNAAAKAQKAQTSTAAVSKTVAASHIQHHAIAPQSTSANTPEEQAKILEARRQLYQHSIEYYDSAFGNNADVESEVIKQAQKRKQQEQEKEQEEEQKKQEMAQLEEQKKKELPVAVTRARNKAESNRGVSG